MMWKDLLIYFCLFIILKLFWEKRLQGLQAFDAQTEVLRNVDLPAALQGVGPNVEDQTVLQVWRG